MTRIRVLLKEWVDRKIILGAQVFSLEDGVACHIVAGEAAPGTDVTPDIVGRLYCANKPVLAVSTGIASEEGLVGLHTPLSHYFDDCTPAMAAVTIADLLGHTVRLPPTLYKNTASLDERARRIVTCAVPRPGNAHYNAQTTSALLGAILERVYSMPLEHVIAEKVAAPLALRDLSLVPRPGQQYGPLHRRDGSMRFVPVEDEARGLSPVNPGQAGVSTAAGMGLVYADLLNSLKGHGTLLAPSTAMSLLEISRSIQLYDLGPRSWGLGFQRDLQQGILGAGWSRDTFGHVGTAPRRIVVLHAADPVSGRVLTFRLFSIVDDHRVQQLTTMS
ncbi:serine hydrolase domain-containing protein [Streptomyces sp. NBC_01235]|uniref:serine hydrolase domain-containing protein n=1 Tax=Streptomyces sp. NBC_01235 TaxID=2903788 RepID=UPI002E0E437E|nr:beta-lactamase family protein [Streptomyces sp. NBC_01235]